MRDILAPPRYELLDCIGRGGLAEVYRANQIGFRGFRRRVAVKLLRPELVGDERHRERLVHEARLGATLEHPNIIRTLDLTVIDGNPAVVLEFVEGLDFFQLLSALTRAGARLPIELGVFVATEILEGLAHATDLHGPSLVHGDVTPGNIMLSRHGEVLLIDFGVASTAADGAMRGKAGYLSPELVRGDPPDHRSDLFALATTLWESLTLRRLFANGDDAKTRDNVLNVRITARFTRARRIPEPLLAILRRALAPSPADRFGHAREFAAALKAWQREAGLKPSRDDLAEFLRQHEPPPPPSAEAPALPEPPPLPSTRLDLSGLEDAIALLDKEPATSSFVSLALGELDGRLERIASDTPAVGADNRVFSPLGSLDPLTVPAILAAIARSSLTGALVVTDGLRRKSLFFEEGGLVQVASNIEAELLGHRLAKSGLIPEPMAETAYRYARTRGLRVGQALVELQATTPEGLATALDKQLADRFIDLLSWSSGRLVFESNRLVDGPATEKRARLDTLTLVVRGMRETWSDTRIAELLSSIAERTITWTATPADVSRALFLSHSDDQRLTSVEQGSCVGERAAEGRSMRFVLAALILLGFVRVA